MKTPILALAAVLALAAAHPARAEEPLAAGSYEIRYRLELPHIESREEATVTACLIDVGGQKAFPVLSANNPLSHCPARNVRREGDEVSFEIVCPGGNTAKAYALFDLRGESFTGRIDMNMGGKNMTMTEVQRGRRVGDCAAAEGSATAPAAPRD